VAARSRLSGERGRDAQVARSQAAGACSERTTRWFLYRFAILASASLRGGIEADLLDEASWWQTDDFWWYAPASGVALIRACADRKGLPVPAFAQQLAPVHEATE
jgi:hypothetical protein